MHAFFHLLIVVVKALQILRPTDVTGISPVTSALVLPFHHAELPWLDQKASTLLHLNWITLARQVCC